MSTTLNLNMSNESNFSLSFLVNMGVSRWYYGNEKIDNNFLSEEFKKKIPRNDIFEINSMMFNITKHKKEILNKYKCFYYEENNEIYIILDESGSFSDFTKEIMMNLFDFSEKLGINEICFLIPKESPEYIRIMQYLMILGFKSKEEIPEIDGKEYKAMKMEVNTNEKIEEFFF